jgi:hypothetical protein
MSISALAALQASPGRRVQHIRECRVRERSDKDRAGSIPQTAGSAVDGALKRALCP